MPPLFILPLSDESDESQIVPYVNYLLIFFNVMVFLILQDAGRTDEFTMAFSTVPAEIITNEDIQTDDWYIDDPATGIRYEITGLQETPIPVRWTLLTSMFMHGGWMHLIGNMLYLYIFGDNIEDDLGHIRYLLFYLASGLMASLAHVFMARNGPSAMIPCLGASGAIAGVLGAYLMLHSQRNVKILVMFRFVTTVPGVVAVGIWFLLQIWGGFGTLENEGGGVAYSAHIGGFLAGGVLVYVALATKPGPLKSTDEEPIDDDDEESIFK